MRKTMKKLTQGATRLAVLALGLGLVSTAWAVYSPGDTVTWSNADGLTASDVVNANHCSWALNIPASSDLPEGSVVSITNVKLASVNQTRTSNSSDTDKLNDPHSIAIGATRSSECSFITSSTLAGKYIDSYDFTDGCEVIVGNNYPANGANHYTSMTGCGVTFLHSNGNRWSGGSRMDCTVGGTTSGIISNGNLYPIYEITATVVSIPALPVKFDYEVAANTVTKLSNNWPSSINNSYSAYMRVSSNGSSLIYDLNNGAGYTSDHPNTAAFSFSLYADVYRMSTTAKSAIAVFGDNGASSNKLILYRDGSNIKMGYYNPSYNLISGTSEVSVTAPTDAAFHLITATCDPTTGALALYIDNGTEEGCSDSVAPDPTVSVSIPNGFQLGNVKGGGLGGSFSSGVGCAVDRMLGFDVVLSSSQVATLAEDYPSQADNVITSDVNFDRSGRTLTLYDSVAQGNQFLGGKYGTVTIAAGNTVSVPHIRTLNSSDATMTMNFAGTVNVTAASQSTIDQVYYQRNNYNGLLFGHWNGAGTATYNITGAINAENAYMATVYGSAMQTFNVNGGTLKVKGLYAYNNNSTINLSNNGLIQVGEVTSGGSPIIRNLGAGTYKVTANATETRAINFNGGEGDYTTLDPVANTLTLNAAAVTGTGDIDVAPSGAGKVVFASLGSSYSGNIKVSSGSAEIQGASGYTGSIEANAPLVINNADDAELSTLSGTGAITKSGAGALTITGTGTSSGVVTINNGGKIILSGNEAKIGTGSFRLTSDGAGIDIIPGAGNTITLAPDFIVSSTAGNTNPYINVGPGKFVAASTGTSTYDYGHFGGATINIANGGELELNANKQLLGANMSGTINVASGGKLTFATYQKNAWTINLNGGAMDVTGSSTPIEVWGQRALNVTEDSSINSVPSGSYTNPNIWINRGGGNSAVNWTINVAEDKTLSFNACIANGSAAASQGNNVVKAGAGTLALNGANGSGYTYSGSTTVNAGTLLINATQSGSAYNLAAGTTLKFGTGANLSVPSLTLPNEGTVTVDVSDLTLSASGTALMTFTTTAPSAADIANKMTVSGAVLMLDGSALKAYPIASLTKADGSSVPYDSIHEAMVGAYHYPTYQYVTVYAASPTEVTLLLETTKLKVVGDSSLVTIVARSAEYSYSAGSPVEGVTTYTLTANPTTYTWSHAGSSYAWSSQRNWRFGDNEQAERYPMAGDSVVFPDGAAVVLDANADCAAITVNGAVAIGGDYGLNVSGNVTGGTGTPVLSISSADLNLSAISSVSGVALVLADSTATVLATTGAALAAIPTTTVEDSYVKTTANVGATTYSVAAKTVVTVSVGANVSLAINGAAVVDGDTFKFTPGDTFTYVATPVANYTANVTVTGGTDNDGTVTVGETAITVAATATLNTYTITIPDVDNATVSVDYVTGGNAANATAAGDISVDYGTDVTANWTAVSGYKITAGASQTLTAVTSAQTLDSPTVEAKSATVSNVAFTYGADYASARVTANVSGDATTATLTYGSKSYTTNVVAGVATFENVTVARVDNDIYAPVSYTITTDVSETTGGTGSSIAADATKWFSASASNTEDGGTWTDGPTPENGKLVFSGSEAATFTPTNVQTGDIVTVTISGVCFTDQNDTVDVGDAQAAIKIASDGSDGYVFQVLTGSGTWEDASGVTPDPATEYNVVVTLDYSTNNPFYTVSVGGTLLQIDDGNSGTTTHIPNAKSGAKKMESLEFTGAGSLTSLSGTLLEGNMVIDKNGTKYATIAAAITAYTNDPTIGPLTTLHSCTAPSGWKIENGELVRSGTVIDDDDHAKTTLVVVPVNCMADELIDTDNRYEGDELIAYNTTDKKNYSWTLSGSKEWVAAEAYAISGGTPTSHSRAASEFALTAGQAVRLVRNSGDSRQAKIVLLVSPASESIAVEVNKGWNLVAPMPKANGAAFDAKTELSVANEGSFDTGDQIVVPTAAAPKTFERRDGKWKVLKENDTPASHSDWGNISDPVWTEPDSIPIPAGKGFWFNSKDNSKSLQF